MNPSLDAALSALRTIMAIVGVLVVAMGWGDNTKVQTLLRTLNEQIPALAGALLVLIPLVWGPIKAWRASKKVETGVNAGIALANQNPGQVTPPVSTEAVPQVIKDYKETQPS